MISIMNQSLRLEVTAKRKHVNRPTLSVDLLHSQTLREREREREVVEFLTQRTWHLKLTLRFSILRKFSAALINGLLGTFVLK